MCTLTVDHSRVKVEENRMKAVFKNDDRFKYEVSEVDGYVITTGIRCDKLVSRKDDHSVLVELKGRNVEHACDQLFASASHPNVQPLLKPNIGFLIICSKYPKFDTFVRKAKDRAMKQYRAGFHVVKNAGEFEISRVTAIDGPN